MKEAQALSLVGWVRNTEQGTVEGEAQGHPENLAEFKVCACTASHTLAGHTTRHLVDIYVEAFQLAISVLDLVHTQWLSQEFLAKRGSPQSVIERCVFSHEFSGHKSLDFDMFEQRH